MVQVIDSVDLEPLAGVYIYNADKSKHVATDEQGIAKLDIFHSNEKLLIYQLGYNLKAIDNHFRKNKTTTIRLTPNGVLIGGEVIVEGLALKQRQLDLPAYVDHLDLSKISASEFQTTADLVGQANGVTIQKSQQGGGSPMMRGFAAHRILLVMDGVRLNNAIFRGGNLQNIISVDPNGLDRIEVLFGPNSLIYGSDALGGVIHMHSKTSAYNSGFGGNIAIGYQSANSGKNLQAGFSYGSKRWSSGTQIGWSDFGDLTMGSNGPKDYLRPSYQQTGPSGKDTIVKNPNSKNQIHSGFWQRFIKQKFSYLLNEKTDLAYQFLYSTTSNIPRYDRLIRQRDSSYVDAEWYYGPQRWLMHSLAIQSKAATAAYSEYRITAAYQTNRESRFDRRFADQILRQRRERVRGISLNADFIKNSDHSMEWRYGSEIIYNKVYSRAISRNVLNGQRFPIQTRYPDGSDLISSALYIQGSRRLNNITLSGGLRYQRTRIRADFSKSLLELNIDPVDHTNDALVWSLGANWSLGEHLFAYANYSKGFRAPNIDDIGKVFDSEPGKVIVPNPQLGPERVGNFELGLQSRTKNPIDYHLSIYYARLTDFMSRMDYRLDGRDSILYDGVLSQVQAIQNTNSGYIYGTEVALKYNQGPLRIGVQLSYQRGQEETDIGTFPLRHVTPLSSSLHIHWAIKGFDIGSSLRYSDGFDAERLAPSEISKGYLYARDTRGRPFAPSWWTADILLSRKQKNWSLEAGVYNIFDKLYRPYASGISAPGRSLNISVRYALGDN